MFGAMDTSWWPALGAVVLLALVATLVDGWGRGRKPRRGRERRRTRPPGRPLKRGRAPARLPEPAEIWWANVPYEDRQGAKDRPCLVLAVRGQRVTVAKITSRNRAERDGVIALPPGSVGDAGGRASYLETDELRVVPVRDFRRRVGVMDPAVWDQVRHLSK